MLDKELIKKIMATETSWNKRDGFNVENQINQIVKTAKRSYLRNYSIAEIEDAFMESIMYVLKRANRDPEYAKTVSISSVTFKMRTIALRNKRKELGLTQRGTIPKGGKTLHISNYYDAETGDNQIEKMAIDENGEIIIGN